MGQCYSVTANSMLHSQQRLVRKRGKGKRRDEDDDEQDDAAASSTQEVSFASEREISAVLAKNIPDCSDKPFFDALAAHMQRPLNQKFQVC